MFGKKNAPPSNHFDTLISNKAEIVGDIHFSGGLHIDGKVFGNIVADDDSNAVLRISDTGVIEGEVSVPHVIVNGSIAGDVHACEHIELAAKAAIKGNIFYNTIEMLMGSQVDGRITHRYKSVKGSEKAKMPKQVTREKPTVALIDRDGEQQKALPVQKPSDKASTDKLSASQAVGAKASSKPATASSSAIADPKLGGR